VLEDTAGRVAERDGAVEYECDTIGMVVVDNDDGLYEYAGEYDGCCCCCCCVLVPPVVPLMNGPVVVLVVSLTLLMV
jgi:hypothetical protein